MFKFGVLYLCRGREARSFFESGVSIFNTPIQKILPGERRNCLTYSEANKGLQLCAPQNDCNGSQGSAETLCRFPCLDRTYCMTGFWVLHSLYPREKYMQFGRRFGLWEKIYCFIPGNQRESQTYCSHVKIGSSGRWHTA